MGLGVHSIRIPSIYGGGIFPVLGGNGADGAGRGSNEYCDTQGTNPGSAPSGTWGRQGAWTNNDNDYTGSNAIVSAANVSLDSAVGVIGSVEVIARSTLTILYGSTTTITGTIFVADIGTLAMTTGTVNVNGPVTIQSAGQLVMDGGTLTCQTVACASSSGGFTTNNPSVILSGGTIRSTSGPAISVNQQGGFVRFAGTATLDGANGGSNGTALTMTAGSTLTVTGTASITAYGNVYLNNTTDTPGLGATARWLISQTKCGSFSTSGDVSLDSAVPVFNTDLGTPPPMPDQYFLCSGSGTVRINSKPNQTINGITYCTVITGTAGQGQALYWARPGNVKGSLTKGGTGQAGIAVHVTDQNGLPHDTMTDGSGNFSFYTDNDDTTWLIAPGACTWFFTPPMGATIIGPAGNPPWAFTLNPHQSKTLTGSYVGP